MFCKNCGNMLKVEKLKDGSIKRNCDCKGKKSSKKEKLEIDEAHLTELIESIESRIVFTRITELESLAEKLPGGSNRTMIKDFISDVKGGIYVVATCPSQYHIKTAYIHGNKITLDGIYISSRDIPCINRDGCTYKSYTVDGTYGEYCLFSANLQKIKRAKELLQMKK